LKKYLEKLANFQSRKSVRQLTTIYQQSTTTSPQKAMIKTRIFAKPPAKTRLSPQE
jgi:hypothetical protein